MRRIFTITAITAITGAAMLLPTAASASSIPAPDHMAANCHGLAMAIGSSTHRGPAHYGWENGMSTIEAHYAFMDMQGCHA